MLAGQDLKDKLRTLSLEAYFCELELLNMSSCNTVYATGLMPDEKEVLIMLCTVFIIMCVLPDTS